MEIKATMKPGQNGTKRYMEKDADRLPSVRYRYDKSKERRYTTVELIEEDAHWTPESDRVITGQPLHANSQPLAIRVEYWETELRKKSRPRAASGNRGKSYGTADLFDPGRMAATDFNGLERRDARKVE